MGPASLRPLYCLLNLGGHSVKFESTFWHSAPLSNNVIPGTYFNLGTGSPDSRAIGATRVAKTPLRTVGLHCSTAYRFKQRNLANYCCVNFLSQKLRKAKVAFQKQHNFFQLAQGEHGLLQGLVT